LLICDCRNENKANLKAHLDGLNKDLGSEADRVDKERDLSTTALGEHGKGISSELSIRSYVASS